MFRELVNVLNSIEIYNICTPLFQFGSTYIIYDNHITVYYFITHVTTIIAPIMSCTCRIQDHHVTSYISHVTAFIPYHHGPIYVYDVIIMYLYMYMMSSSCTYICVWCYHHVPIYVYDVIIMDLYMYMMLSSWTCPY